MGRQKEVFWTAMNIEQFESLIEVKQMQHTMKYNGMTISEFHQQMKQQQLANDALALIGIKRTTPPTCDYIILPSKLNDL